MYLSTPLFYRLSNEFGNFLIHLIDIVGIVSGGFNKRSMEELQKKIQTL
jgi:hypothetical protein